MYPNILASQNIGICCKLWFYAGKTQLTTYPYIWQKNTHKWQADMGKGLCCPSASPGRPSGDMLSLGQGDQEGSVCNKNTQLHRHPRESRHNCYKSAQDAHCDLATALICTSKSDS